MQHISTVLAISLILSAMAAAAETPPDRSSLSYDENVAINIACAAARTQGSSGFYPCVRQQLAALQKHPSPDRSGLTAARNEAVFKECRERRREGVAVYNDCLKQAMTAKSNIELARADDDLAPNIGEVFTEVAASSPAPVKQAASLPAPQSVLTKRPGAIEQAAVLSPADLYKRVEKSVFVVVASRSLADARSRDIVQGSAVAVSDHLLLTNCHVVEGRPLIKLFQDQSTQDAKLVAADTASDRCVIEASGPKLTAVAGIARFDGLAIGERVFAIGAPRSLERTLSEGLVSGLRHQRNRNLVQTSAPISPGSSGGGLFDEHGNLIGITTLGSIYGAQNLNFAIAAADYWD